MTIFVYFQLSQILGHSDQLYIRLPSGLRFWQIILAVVFSILSLWALMFPGHYFHAMYDMDGSSFTFPIRLYACALICISVMYWSTVQAADRHVIRMILLSSVVFFTLQSGVLMSLWSSWLPSTTPASLLCSVFIAFVARLIVIAVSSYFYWITYRDGKSKDVKYYR
ncbi:tumor protein p53-inducible protein 11-like [Ruditapes philippinarum]|uniref:tumor protein p53-inducible protein 11-like n=1 Tax=Ruditapes philippinarum TaxID=129788 RepID=UPI00295C2A13|nr:tumor protein p53-inducible protein 11-like [Ruditapes philippinarum]